MKHILFESGPPDFEEGLPSGLSPVGHNSAGDMIFRIAEGTAAPEGSREAGQDELNPPADVLQALLRDIEQAADDYHQRFLGAETARREQRFRENRDMALEVQAGTATDATKAALQMQADAQARKVGQETMPLTDFVGWIIDWTPPSRLISSAIESFIVDARTAATATPGLVDPLIRGQFLRDLRAQAEAKFAELSNNIAGDPA